MNRLVFGLVLVAACLGGAATYFQTAQARAQEQQSQEETERARRRAEEATRQAQAELVSALLEAERARRRVELASAYLQAIGKEKPVAEKAPGEFASNTIDLGTVVADVEKSVKFYTEAIGFKELPGFDVDGDFAKDVGLTDGKALKIRKLVLGDGPGATTLKLMELPDAKPKKSDTAFIHSQLGFRYLTIVVTDTNAALKRLEKAGVKPIAKTPKEIPANIAKGLWLTIVRDPDGNFVELVGAKN